VKWNRRYRYTALSTLIRVTVVLLSCLLDVTLADASVQSAISPSASRTSATIYSIGIEWDVIGDDNHNASASVVYRIQGAVSWNAALPLVRIDYNGANMLAGSILFLAPDTPYEVQVALSDPDGGAETRTSTIRTRRLPTLPSGGRTFHVIPGTGGGDGSAGNPFQGIAAAQAAAGPGDTVLIHAGSYGGRIVFDKPGTPDEYLVWKAAGDGEVLMNGLDIAAGHVWLEGITVRDQAYAAMSFDSPAEVVIRRCSFFNNHYSIFLQGAGRDWYIADNTVVGDTPYATQSLDGEGIELNTTSGHTVAHNSITRVADGISSPFTNVDIFGNDIFDTSDDGIEADTGGPNVRMWGNRIHNAAHNGISFQPQSGAPWYIVRNQIVGNMEAAFKFRTTDRFVLLHNTIVNWGNAWPGDSMMCCNEDHLLRAVARNNLWVSVQGGQTWGFDAGIVDWRTDLDYDGIDWGNSLDAFAYQGITYADLPSFAAASGLERHGVHVTRDDCFETFDVPTAPPSPVPAQTMTLKAGCNAIDAGALLPNVDDGAFAGAAPDLGAHEYNRPPAVYGPRADPPGPPAPDSPNPTTGAIWVTTSPTLSWTSPGATSYDIRFGTTNPPATIVSNTTAWYDSLSGLNGATQYYWQIVAKNGSGATPGPVWSFTTDPTAPSAAPAAPGAPSPPNGATSVTTSLTLGWTSAGATSYDVRFGTTNPPPTIVSNTTDPHYAPSGLTGASTYYWQIVARNSGGATTGPVWSFTTESAPPSGPAQPGSPNPPSGQTWITTSPTLSWTSAGATSYEIHFGTANPPPTIVSNTTDWYYSIQGLSNSTTYYWQIIAKNISGSTAGPVWSFKTEPTGGENLYPIGLNR